MMMPPAVRVIASDGTMTAQSFNGLIFMRCFLLDPGHMMRCPNKIHYTGKNAPLSKSRGVAWSAAMTSEVPIHD
jgi:hypothetical protein